MSLPTYNKNDRRKSFELLPKGAYVIRILGAKEEPKKNGKTGTNLVIAFDIAEGEYANFYNKQFEGNSDENKKWPNDGTYYLNVPGDDSPAYVWTNWNSFFADLEDSNNGFVFSGDVKSLKGKLIGGKFANDQSSYNGNVYDHTRLKWTCVADDVRNGKPGKMPKDKLIPQYTGRGSAPQADENGFMSVPDGVDDEEVPF
jgi:hypothetical protein